jgi:hypothetical protein
MALPYQYSGVIETMKDGGIYRLYTAEADPSDPQRMQTLWSIIDAGQKELPSGLTNCYINFKTPENYALMMDEIAVICDSALKIYTGDIIWDYEEVRSNKIVLEVIG